MVSVAVISLAVLALLSGFVVGRWFSRREPLEQLVPPAAESRAESSTAAATRTRTDIERALADLRLGVVVVDGDGDEVYRNNQAKQYATGRHGDALVEVALERVFEGAMLGLSLEETIEVYGPPARSVLIQASPTYDGGALSGAVGVIEDVTEAKRIDRVRSDFVANVSHELRTPIGAVSVLAETISGADDPEVIDRLTKRMQREASRLGDTIDDLLALSRLESGPVADPETIDLGSVVAMAVERTSEAAKVHGVMVNPFNTTGGPILVDGDQGQLISAMANLIDNALKYSDQNGEVTVQLETRPPPPQPVEAADAATAGARGGDGPASRFGLAKVSVVDTGIGIPSRDHDRIFERFYRVDSARSRETGGTGLGLSIVRNALANHGGTISVESTEGVGSTFTIRLPLSASQAMLSGPDAGPDREVKQTP